MIHQTIRITIGGTIAPTLKFHQSGPPVAQCVLFQSCGYKAHWLFTAFMHRKNHTKLMESGSIAEECRNSLISKTSEPPPVPQLRKHRAGRRSTGPPAALGDLVGTVQFSFDPFFILFVSTPSRPPPAILWTPWRKKEVRSLHFFPLKQSKRLLDSTSRGASRPARVASPVRRRRARTWRRGTCVVVPHGLPQHTSARLDQVLLEESIKRA